MQKETHIGIGIEAIAFIGNEIMQITEISDVVRIAFIIIGFLVGSCFIYKGIKTMSIFRIFGPPIFTNIVPPW